MKTLSEMAPIDMDEDDSMVIAARQVLFFKNLRFDLNTARVSLFLPPSRTATWDETCEEMAEIWEGIRHEAEEAIKRQAKYRQIGLATRGAPESEGPEISGSSSQVPLCKLWTGRPTSGSHPDGA